MLEFALFAVLASIIFYMYLKWNYGYWKKRGVPTMKPVLGFGNLGDAMSQKRSPGMILEEAYRKFEKYSYFGFYKLRQPTIVVRNLELIEKVLVKDFSTFHKNDFDISEKNDPLFGKNPFVSTGELWKSRRNQLITNLTAGKIKLFFSSITEVTDKLTKYLLNNPDAQGPDGIEAKDLCTKFTIDVVAAFALGIDSRSFVDSDAEFRRITKLMLEPSTWRGIELSFVTFWPAVANLFGFKLVVNEAADFFRRILREVIKSRQGNEIRRNDFIDVMMQLEKKATKGEEFNIDNMAAHLITFFTDGYETSSLAISFALYELAVNPDVFQKARNEIDEVLAKYNGQITYDAIQEMSYLDCVFSESLRKYPPSRFMVKNAMANVTFPRPKEDQNESDVIIEKGTPVYIPISALHYDPQYFPDPHKFDPERFSAERKSSIVKYTYLPFGEGPRICIGQRLAQGQSKAALATIVSRFDIKLNKKTCQPLELDPAYVLTSAKGGIWINFYKRKLD